MHYGSHFFFPEMGGIVQSFRFNTGPNIGLLMASNVTRFMQSVRSTNSQYEHVPVDQRRSVNTVLAAMLLPPPLPRVGAPATRLKGNISGRQLFRTLGISKGSHHLLKASGKARTVVKDSGRRVQLLGSKEKLDKGPYQGEGRSALQLVTQL